MKLILSLMIGLVGASANAQCLNIDGSYEIAFGMPECAAGVRTVKAWRKIEQRNCINVSVTKVYKLIDGSFCEGSSFFRSDDGKEVQYPGSEYASTYQILAKEHVSKVRHLTDPSLSFELSYKLDSNENLIMRSTYSDGTTNEESFLRSAIQ
jgi:hypothetical protein